MQKTKKAANYAALVRDLMSGNLVAGILQLTEALFTALAIALGYSAVLILTGGGLFG